MIAVRGLVHRLSSFGSRPNPEGAALLRGVDLELERGEVVLLMGRNGSGKTTLARYIAGLLIPTEGTVTVDGLRDLREMRRRVGLLFQESHEQIIAQTPLEDVAFGLENLALPAHIIQQRSWRALEQVGLQEKALCTIEVLTPAERQRVALAGVLAMGPEYYILDEPDRTADRDGLALLLSLVRELRSEGRGVLIISHKEFWSEHVDRVLSLEQGTIKPSSPLRPSLQDLTPSPSGRGVGMVREPSLQEGSRERLFRLQANDLSFAYGTTPVLRDLSAQISPGEFIVITGPDGSGKSTLAELLAGLAQPTSGCVLWNGTPINALRPSVRARSVGLVFQEPHQQLLGESVREEILLGLAAQGISEREREHRMRWACEAVGLDWDRFFAQPSHCLSGGEQARLAIAAVIALEPRVLILDETLSALDPAGQAALLTLLHELHTQGTTVLVMASEEIPQIGTRLWRLDGGRLLYDGPS